VQDLKRANTAALRAEFGVVMERTQRELQETPCIDMSELDPAKKQIVCSRSFGQMLTELASLKDAVSLFVANACQKLRAQQSHARLIHVFLRTNRFRPELAQHNPSLSVPLPHPTNDTLHVNKWADFLITQMFKTGYGYKKAGVMLSEITPITHQQLDLWEPVPAHNAKLMNALDELNTRYGRATVRVSSQGAYIARASEQNWKMKQHNKSPNYTTNWSELPKV
jgi:DNA polymerase V